MIKFFAAAALLASLAAPAVASDAPATRSFVRDGQTFIYTSTKKGDRLVLEGRRLPSGSSFQFTVRNGRVTGHSGGVPVSFAVADVVSTSNTTLASR